MKRVLAQRAVSCILMLGLSFSTADAQRIPRRGPRLPSVSPSATASMPQSLPEPLALKRAGHYTVNDWRKLVDSAWGPGLSTESKLEVFDRYWTEIDQDWGGFPNLIINWDSLKNVYRPLVAAGISRGRFYGILSRLTRALVEWHSYVNDTGIDSTLGITGAEYPNMPSFRYRSGVPLINLGATILRTAFGAGITSLDDSLALVYRVMPNHPLGLQPGDIILGYDGIPWRQLLQQLLDAELPIIGGGRVGSTPTALNEILTMYVGMNWGLFDTIDVMKYPTNEVVHFPTSLLKSITPPYFVATEQLPVKGVSFPNLDANDLVSWGVVEGTNIGYVYAWDWYGSPMGRTRTQFGQAVDELLHTHNVEGLILDWRTNLGGWEFYANDGLKQLFSVDPTDNGGRAIRVRGNDHFQFSIGPPHPSNFFTPAPKVFDHPIAVLTGHLCGSAGDWNAFRMRFHPMVRFFGKPTAGAYADASEYSYYGTLVGPYFCDIYDGSFFSKYNNEGFMIHKAFPVDDDVWLTREGVAQGKDHVVMRALQWMDSLAYAHDISVNKDTVWNATDSIRIVAQVTNRGQHALIVSAIVTTAQGTVVDSVVLTKAPAGSLWDAHVKAPPINGRYNISVRTADVTAGTYRRLPNVAWFTSIVTGVTASAEELPRVYGLKQNYPNPFNPATVVSYQLPAVSDIRLAIYDVLGREVAVLVDEQKAPGSYQVTFDAAGLSSGVYFYRLTAGNFVQTRKMVVAK